MAEAARIAGLLLLGGWVGADTTAALQLMVSQPVVAAWLAGVVVGQPAAGLAVGVILQVIWGRSFAMGGASFPVVGPGAVVAGALAGWASQRAAWPVGALSVPDAASLAVALGAGWGIAEWGRRRVQALRRARDPLVRRAIGAAEAADGNALVRINLLGVVQGAGLGAALTAAGLVLGGAGLLLARGAPVADGRWVGLAVLGAGLGDSVLLLRWKGRSAWLGLTLLAAATTWVIR